jgi:D-serine deaminase-like pyridoxal phosphate-dependent protein
MNPIRVGQSIEELPTPSLIVDIDKMQGNINSWQQHVDQYGVALRPHIKTHKVPDIAKMQIAY